MKKITFNTNDLANLDKSIADTGISVPLIAVYCGASSGFDERFTAQAYELGQRLANAGFGVVYGGAGQGMMGAVADGVLSQGGVVVGVIPEFLMDREIAHDKLTALWITDTMHTRKTVMATYATGFVALAGGFGTLEELFEVATWRQIDQHAKPIAIMNSDGFYTPLLAQLDKAVECGFLKSAFKEFIEVGDNPEQIVALLTKSA